MKDNNLKIFSDKKKLKIGILGAPINNGNMGCLALTYSLLAMLEEISKELGIEFYYYDFEGEVDSTKTQMLCRNLGINVDRLTSNIIYPVESFLGFCHRPFKAIGTMTALKKCDFFIDLTEGDSFTDIYGDFIFNRNSNGKLLIESILKKPLILGPQTYGPYRKDKNRAKAKKAIEAAAIVMTRDEASAKYVKLFTDRQIYTTTDLAFRLPYMNLEEGSRDNGNDHSKIKVGVNISGLLSRNKTEATPTEFQLKTDYDAYVNELLKWLIDNNYEVSLIPHVSADYECGKVIAERYPQIKQVQMYQNPMDIKSHISRCDIFIGARMHATVGAFSSGVATIPTAYSRKFNGLYESVGYYYIVDLLNDPTEENLDRTKEYVMKYKELKAVAQRCMDKINALENETIRMLKEQILNVMNQK